MIGGTKLADPSLGIVATVFCCRRNPSGDLTHDAYISLKSVDPPIPETGRIGLLDCKPIAANIEDDPMADYLVPQNVWVGTFTGARDGLAACSVRSSLRS